MRFLRLSAARLVSIMSLSVLLGSLLLVGAVRVRADAGNSVTYAAGWNLVAFPPNTDVSKITAPLYTMQPGDTDYETIPVSQGTVSGFGYWAYFGASTQITLDAGSANLYSVLAPPNQYIMVGNPSGTQSSVVTGANVVYTYDPTNGYVQSPVLPPGQGAWVLSTDGGPVMVQPGASGSGGPPAGAQPPAGRFFGSVTSGGQPAAGGTAIIAQSSNGATCGQSTVGAAPATGSNYALDLTGTDASCSTAGSTLTFTVGGSPANGSDPATVPDVSGAVHVDLTVP